MVNRERFMLDCDSEGFVEPEPNPLAGINVGKLPDVELAHALLTDERCLRCPPSEQCPRSGYCETRAAQHLCICIAGVNGQPCTCKSVERAAYRNPKGWDQIDGTLLPEINWAEGQREKGDILRSMQDCANINHDGITRLSDTAMDDPFFGWKV